MTRILLAAALAAGLAACGDDPVSYSSPVVINLKAESGAVNGTALTNEKSIKDEAGNPYAAFVTEARAKLGRDPTLIEVDDLTLTLGALSTGVTKLEEVFQGTVDVLFVVGGSNNTYPVGALEDPSGLGPVGVDVSFEARQLAAQDWPHYLAGDFKVSLRGTAAPTFASKGAKADLQLAFTFAAFE